MPDVNRFTGPNAGYIAELYERYLIDPASVDAGLRAYFESFVRQPDSLDQAMSGREAVALPRFRAVTVLVEVLRTHGHLAANLDPLGLRKPVGAIADAAAFGLSLDDLGGLPGLLVDGPAGAGT
ncbi:MAG: 2-oxoglutarate dehydrogenase E1 component, partial [Chloroflexi bacterium]|nr:2-oxoglutarate dehydrogenase E1 component [Chloroflexota bacterium]